MYTQTSSFLNIRFLFVNTKKVYNYITFDLRLWLTISHLTELFEPVNDQLIFSFPNVSFVSSTVFLTSFDPSLHSPFVFHPSYYQLLQM